MRLGVWIGHCGCPLSRQLPGGFVRRALFPEGKIRAVAGAREASADRSIFPPIGRVAFSPYMAVSPTVRWGTSSSSALQHSADSKALAPSFPGSGEWLTAPPFASRHTLPRTGGICKSSELSQDGREFGLLRLKPPSRGRFPQRKLLAQEAETRLGAGYSGRPELTATQIGV
jgi:hypothetical protein